MPNEVSATVQIAGLPVSWGISCSMPEELRTIQRLRAIVCCY